MHPLTPARWPDLLDLFGPNGARGGCWCMAWRLTQADFGKRTADERRDGLHAVVTSATPSGMLAYEDGHPVGWCSLGPRGDFARLQASRTLDAPASGVTWSVTCFYVRRGYLRKGIASALLRAACEFAAEHGASTLEAYPGRNSEAGVDSRGGIHLFDNAGFTRAASRSNYFVVMRKTLAS